jgi:hypothetical protein
MVRRAFLAAVALLLTRRLSVAQQRPTGEQNVREVLDIQGMVTKALRVATKVEEEAEQKLRQAVDQAFRRIEVPNVRLRDLSLAGVPELFVAQSNLPTLLFAVLQAGKTSEGIIVTRAAVERSLREYCPLYPFC